MIDQSNNNFYYNKEKIYIQINLISKHSFYNTNELGVCFINDEY